jgi:hypothetical protein
MNRLDRVLGIDGWKDRFDVLGSGAVQCTLSLRLGNLWVSKQDVGGPSDQEDAGDRMKAAFSDALKRAAVKFGIGRYLYSMPGAWEDWDPDRKCFANEKRLRTAAALNREMGKPTPPTEANTKDRNGPAGRAPAKPKPPTPRGTANEIGSLTMADAASRKCTLAELTELVGLLKQKGLSWADLIRVAQWRPASVMDDLHLVGYTWAVAYLRKQPDAAARA